MREEEKNLRKVSLSTFAKSDLFAGYAACNLSAKRHGGKAERKMQIDCDPTNEIPEKDETAKTKTNVDSGWKETTSYSAE